MHGLEWKAAIGCRVFVEAVLCVRHCVIGHRLAEFFDSDVWDKNWRNEEAILFTGITDPSERREPRLGTVGCIVRLASLAIWVVSLSCLWPQWCKAYLLSFTRVLSSSKRGCGRLFTVLDCGQVEYLRSVLYFWFTVEWFWVELLSKEA